MDENNVKIEKSGFDKKMIYKWKCKQCGDIVKSDVQPYCKTCSHIERFDVKMEKLENK